MSSQIEGWLTLAAHLAAAPIPRRMLEDSRATESLRQAALLIGAPAGAVDVASLSASLESSPDVRAGRTSIELTAECRKAVLGRVDRSAARRWTEPVLAYLDAFAPMNSDDPTTWDTWRALEPHVRHAADLATQHGIRFPTGRLLGEGLGVFVFLTRSKEEALQLFERALEIDSAHFGPNSPEVAADLNNLAFALREHGDTAQADELLIRAMQILCDHENERPGWFAVAVGNMADMLHGLGRDAEAEPLYRRAAGVAPERLPDQPATPGLNLRKLAEFLADTGRKPEAEDVLRRALAVDERLLGPHHPNVAADLRGLVDLLHQTAEPAGLLPLLRRAIQIDLGSRRPDDPTLSADRVRLAYLSFRIGDTEAAGNALAELAGLSDAALAPLGDAAQDALRKLADLRVQQGRVADALAAARRLIRLLEAAPRVPAKRLAEARSLVASLLDRAGHKAEARALRVAEEERGLREHLAATPNDADALNKLGMLLKNERGDYAAAEKCYRDALVIDPSSAITWNNLAVLLGTVLGRHDEAERAYRRSLELSPQDPNTLANYAALIQNERRDFEVAAGLYRMAFETGRADAGMHANFASLLVCMKELPAAIDLLKQAWEMQQGHHDRVSARVLFLRAAIERLQGRTAHLFLGQLRTVLQDGIAHAPWRIGSLMQTLQDRLPPADVDLFGRLAGAIASRERTLELAGSAPWNDIPALPLDTPWDAVLEV